MFETLRALKAYAVPNTKLAIWSRVWSKEKLLCFIRQLSAQNNNSLYVKRNHPREFAAAVREFGSWGEALESAGLSASDIRRHHLPYTKLDIEQFIHGAVSVGTTLSTKAVSSTRSGNGLYQAARRLYGGWNQALRANRVDPDAVNEYSISKQATVAKLIQFILSRHAASEASQWN